MNDIKTPIIKELKKYTSKDPIRFHMPGHKGRNSFIEWGNHIPGIDVTEIDGTDNLHNPKTIIKESQELAAKAFGAKHTFFSVNGTTAGIYSAIMAVTEPGDKVAIQRNSHRSVYNAAILGRLKLSYIYPEYDNKNHVVTGVRVEDIEEALTKDHEIKAVVVTYPSYYGICADIKQISKTVHKHNRLLIVDEAHGSHLAFNNNLPVSALKAGADIVIQSAHKTLPAFTQASLVHVGSERVDVDRLKTLLSMHQTTSPSYMLMASLDGARAYMEQEGFDLLDQLIHTINHYTSYMRDIRGIRIINRKDINGKGFYDFDTTKIIISLEELNISGTRLERILREDFGIQLEMADLYYGLALTSVMNKEEDIKGLAKALKAIAENTTYRQQPLKEPKIDSIKTVQQYDISEAFYKKVRRASLESSEGRIAGGFLIPYPPGIPLLCPGEKITKEIIDYIRELKANDIEILGFLDYNKDEIKVIE